MNIHGLLHLSFLGIIKCVSAGVLSQLESTVRVRSGHPTTLQCYVLPEGDFSVFWIKIPLNRAPEGIATATSYVDAVKMYKPFENHSRINVNRVTFNLSFLSVEQTDAATYICGRYEYRTFMFGNGSKLILEEDTEELDPTTVKDSKENNGKIQIAEFLVPTLVATNVASVFLIILLCHCLKKNKAGVSSVAIDAGDNNTDEVKYAGLTFGHKQRRTAQKRTSAETSVIYGAVKLQEE